MTFEDQYSEFLEHYGVPGMRWGVRRERRRSQGSSKLETTTKKGIKSEKAAYKKAKTNVKLKRYDVKMRKHLANAAQLRADLEFMEKKTGLSMEELFGDPVYKAINNAEHKQFRQVSKLENKQERLRRKDA